MPHPQYLTFRNEKIASEVAGYVRKAGGVLRIDGCDMHFDDKITYDYVVYHYVCKMPPGSVTKKTEE